MQAPIRLIAFDLFGVVISEGHMVSNALMPLLSSITDKQSVKKHYQAYTLGTISEAMFWRAIGQDDYHDLRKTFLDTFELDSSFRATAKRLSTHYQLAILSNLATDWGEYLLDKFGLADIFSIIILSGEVKCGKPRPAIYERLITQSGCSGNTIAFIDDRLENLATANECGMTTIHFKREIDDHPYAADHVITDMTNLIELFANSHD